MLRRRLISWSSAGDSRHPRNSAGSCLAASANPSPLSIGWGIEEDFTLLAHEVLPTGSAGSDTDSMMAQSSLAIRDMVQGKSTTKTSVKRRYSYGSNAPQDAPTGSPEAIHLSTLALFETTGVKMN